MQFIRNILNRRKWARWSNTPKDLVIFHTFGKADTIPSASPFVLKVQTYLRMTNIPHKIDSRDMFGPNGKAPWISLNGEHTADSEFIIKRLNKHFNKDLNKGPYSEKELAIATCARVVFEEHTMWGCALERVVYNPSQFRKVISVNPVYDTLLVKFGGRLIRKRADAQGIGRHSQADVEELCTKDLVAVSKLLNKNKFFLGDVPCQDDCAIFGGLAVVLWGLPNSPYEHLLQRDLTNLRDYCLRMRDTYYPDWDKCIRRPNVSGSSPPKEKATAS